MSDGHVCDGCVSRRRFCAATGASLLSVAIGGCGPSTPRVSEGSVEGPAGTFGSGNAGGANVADAGAASDGGSCTPGTLVAGAAASYTIGTPRSFVNAVAAGGVRYTIFVTQDANGFYAMDADCTHAGCPVSLQGTTYYCSCHGASFDANGQHTSGPGSGYLQHYAVCIDAGGNVTVDLQTPAAPTQRF